jgi:3-dehydroquinate dehydratase-2
MARKAVSASKAAKPAAAATSAKAPKASKAIAKPVYVLNGPNLNLLGLREPEIYGSTSLADIEKLVAAHAKARGVSVLCLQSNHEGDLVTWVQEARSMASGLIINPAAYSHTSIAIHDALAMLDIPVVEVHISNVHKREEFRHFSFMSSVVTGVICGLGVKGYTLALDAIIADISK